MVLYELFCISRPDLERVANVALFQKIGNKILDLDGVLRKITTTGKQPLPYRIRNQGEYLTEGLYWSLIFNMSPRCIDKFGQFLKFENRLVRTAILKQAVGLAEEAKSFVTQK